MIFHAVVNGIPYIEVSARNDDEARRRVIERCRRERADGFLPQVEIERHGG